MLKSIFLIVVLSSSIFAQISAIKLSCNFENGYIPQWSTMSYKSKDVYSYGKHIPTFFTSTAPKIEYKGIYVMSNYTFFWAYQEGTTGTPFRSLFEFECGYTFKMITLKYAHGCNHTITTIPDDLKTTKTLYDIAHDKFSIVVNIHN